MTPEHARVGLRIVVVEEALFGVGVKGHQGNNYHFGGKPP